MSNARPFYDFLREHRNGATHDELADALQSLVADVAAEGRGGKMVLTISVKPADAKGGGALIVADEIKVMPPKRTKGASIFFVSPENNLVRDDPTQMRLPLHEVAAREAPLPMPNVGRALA